MKKILWIILILTSITISGCKKFLTEKPYSFLTPLNFPQTPIDADAALAGAYNAMSADFSSFRYRATLIVCMQNDLFHGGDSWGAFISDGASDFYDPFWRLMYQGINSCNNLIASLGKRDAAKDPWITSKIAEARSIRALYYFFLVRFFGDIPLLLEPTSSSVIKSPRSPVPDVYNAIIEDLTYADGKLENKANGGGRFTNGAVNSLLAQVYATAAGWRRTPEGQMVQGDAKYWTLAKDKAKEVVESNTYMLNPDYSEIWKNMATDVYDPEIILDVQFSKNNYSTFPYIYGPRGVNGATPESGAGNANAACNIEWIRTLDGNDERYKWNIADYYFDQETSWHTLPEPDSNNFQISTFQKYPKFFDGYWDNWLTNWPLIRFADIKLLYAEALNEVNGGPTTEAYAQINGIRYRARPTAHKTDGTVLPDLVNLNQTQFRNAIMAERAMELPNEGVRKFDLIRWGNLKEKIDANKTQEVWLNGGMPIRAYLAPVPVKDLDINAWKQNDGY